MKKAIQIFLFFLVSYSYSQVDYSNSWEDYYSYNNVKRFVKVNDVVYAMVDNAIFTYNTSTNEIHKISSVNGLSGEVTTAIYYSKSTNKLIIGYDTGLIEIIDKNDHISIAKDIVNFNYSGFKNIYDITEYNGKLYLATPFAIIEYDIENERFGDTFFIGDNSSELRTYRIRISNGIIYAATEDGIYTASVDDPSLIDFNNWTKYSSGSFSIIEVFNDEVFAARDKNLYKFSDGELTLVKSYPQSIRNIYASEDYISIATLRGVFVKDVNLVDFFSYTTNTSSDYYYVLNMAYFENNTLYLGTREFGLLKSEKENIPNFEEFHPEGPVSNLPFSIAANENDLWVVYGGYDASYAPRGRSYGYSHFNGNNWVNTPYSKINMRDLVHVTFDPDNNDKVFISSWGGGMIIVENDEVITRWTHQNSGLEWLTRINGSAFDQQGNLWIANAWVNRRIKKFSVDGTWSGFEMNPIMTNLAAGLNELVIDKMNTVWVGSRRNGVLVYNENGDKKKALVTEPTKGSLPDPNARTVVADANNNIWIGTLKGLVVLNNAENVFNSNNIDAEPIIILDNGVPKKLLGDQAINSIALDGADNKWIGTDLGGVIQTSPDGKTILKSFNKSNSPLPSNNITKIAVDKSNEKIYFATSKGIVAYNGGVTPYGDSLPDVYAYPNPSTKNNEIITIDGRNGAHLPNGTNIKILDTAGNLVYESNIKEGQQEIGGKIEWNKTNLAGKKVASGIYIVMLIANDNTETAITKIAIIN
jgi:ligand-binding sensor domain-containing protein